MKTTEHVNLASFAGLSSPALSFGVVRSGMDSTHLTREAAPDTAVMPFSDAEAYFYKLVSDIRKETERLPEDGAFRAVGVAVFKIHGNAAVIMLIDTDELYQDIFKPYIF